MKEWLVKQPGEHGSKLRVVERVGLTVEGKEIFAGVCEMLTSRSSTDNFSDKTEQDRAALIVRAVNSHLALVEACKSALREMQLFRAYWTGPNMNLKRTKATAEELCESALALAKGGDL